MGTSALGGLASGIMQGQTHMDTRRRNKAVDNLLERDAYEKDLEFSKRRDQYDAINNGDMSGWEDFIDPQEEDPYAGVAFKWLKKTFGFGPKTDDVTGVEPYPGAEPTRTAVPRFADGGKVYTDEERMKRSYGDYYVTEEEAAANRDASPTEYVGGDYRVNRTKPGVDRQAISNSVSGGGPRAAIDDLKRAASETNTAQSIRNFRTNYHEGMANAVNQDTPEGAGKATRQALQTTGQGVLNVAGGLGTDLVESTGLANVGRTLRGFVGRGGTRENRQPDPGTPAPVTEGKQAPTQAIETSLGKGESDQAMAGKAVDAAVEMTPGHPDNPDQTFDASEIAASGVRPEDIPPAQVEDWARYRRLMASAAAKGGGDPQQVQMDITKMQQDSFSANAMQAAFLLKQGDPRGAAIAMRIAYQYFPNGSDITFGIAEGKNGPVLVANGVDQKSGEQVGDGTPMVLNPDSIMRFADTAKDVTRWQAWTKDWHEMARKDREYNEITKPQAQQELNTGRAREEALLAAAAKDKAYVSSGGKQSGGPKQSDMRASLEQMSERLFGQVDADDLGSMEALAERLRQAVPDAYSLGDAQIVDLIMKAYETDDFAQIDQILQRQ